MSKAKSLAIGNDTLKRTDRCAMHYQTSPKPKLDWDGGREADELPLGGFWTVYSLSPLRARTQEQGRRNTAKRGGRAGLTSSTATAAGPQAGRSPGPTFDPFCWEIETGLKVSEKHDLKLFTTPTVSHRKHHQVRPQISSHCRCH